MTAYYNEIDPFAAQWLRNLISAGLIASGDVDERSIDDVRPSELTGYTQCHFFAGIGGWSYALRLAGWPDDRAVWTGSCPCQPFSAAGKGTGFADERHLWPAWFHLIRECRPSHIMGEQVDKALDWLDLIQSDLEGEEYSCGAVIAPATSIGAPHRRNRLYFVAHSISSNPIGRYESGGRLPEPPSVEQGWAFAEWNGRKSRASVLDDGISNRLAKHLANGLGNAIVPQLAAQVIRAYMECRP